MSKEQKYCGNVYFRVKEKRPEHDTYIFLYDTDEDKEILVRYMGNLNWCDNPGQFPLWRYAEIRG